MTQAPTAAAEVLDEVTLGRLYLRLEGPLYNVVYRWLWHPEDAQDVVQEAFVRLWKRRATVKMDTVEPLVYRIALNLAANRRRRRKVWRWVTLEALRTQPDKRDAPDTRIAAQQDKAALEKAIDALPEGQRQVMLLCEFAELSYAEIAEILGVPAGTVASRRHSALKNLRKTLQAEKSP